MTRKPIEPPVFVASGAKRVLIEATEWATREVLGAILRSEGYDVIACGGPEGTGSRCALVATGECIAAHEADAVVHTLRHSDARNREVLHSLKTRYPDTPIIVEVPAPRVAQFRDDFNDCHVIAYPITEDTLVRALDTVLAPDPTRPSS